MKAREQYINKLQNSWRDIEEEELGTRVLKDGERLKVSLAMMDAAQREFAGYTPLVVSDAHQNALTASKRTADRVNELAAQFSAAYEPRHDDSAYGRYCAEIQDAWRATK